MAAEERTRHDETGRLTGRQKQILDLLCKNMTSRQVGTTLGICARTVDNHCVNICRVLRVADRFEAVRVWSAIASMEGVRAGARVDRSDGSCKGGGL